jgi:hypothetical protein
MNSDGRLDLVLARHGSQSLLFIQDESGGFGDGKGGDEPLAFGPSHGFSGMVVYDYNIDGYPDFLGLSNDVSRPSQLFCNALKVSDTGFVELPTTVGLDNAGYTHGAVAADFGGPNGYPDRLPDLYLGRPSSSDAFYYQAGVKPGADSDIHYVAFRLDGASGVTNKRAVGAMVEVQAGDRVQVQQIDGGSLRGGQASPELIFGLGNYTGLVTAKITWPDGMIQADVPVLIDQLNVISNAPVDVQESTMAGTYLSKPNGLVDWIFTWDVDGPSDPALDAVIFDPVATGPQCLPQVASISSAMSDVTLTYTANPNGGYTHVMIWEDRECVPNCGVYFDVESGLAGQTDISDVAARLRMRICANY